MPITPPAIPAGITPEHLRREADRRELITKVRGIEERRAARNELCDALRSIPITVVRKAGGEMALRAAMARLLHDDEADAEQDATNSDVSNLSHRGGSGWWDEFRREVPHVEIHPDLTRAWGHGAAW